MQLFPCPRPKSPVLVYQRLSDDSVGYCSVADAAEAALIGRAILDEDFARPLRLEFPDRESVTWEALTFVPPQIPKRPPHEPWATAKPKQDLDQETHIRWFQEQREHQLRRIRELEAELAEVRAAAPAPLEERLVGLVVNGTDGKMGEVPVAISMQQALEGMDRLHRSLLE